MARQLCREDYTVGWVCALPVELAAAQEMLDEEDETPQCDVHDTNIYTCGRVGEHNVVIACLPEGQMGTNSAAAVAVQMKSTFTSTRFGLMVGIGGGVPSEEADIRLGDIVVSKPHKVHGGVVQYDCGKATPSGFERTGSLNTPPTILLTAIANLRAKHIRGRSKLVDYILKLKSLPDFRREAAGSDTLFEASYDHKGGVTCSKCSKDYVVNREARRQEVMVHYGTVASGNQVMRNAAERDRVSAELGGVLCFEMEAAGLMNSFPCLVIRGVCDYADSHKNKHWQAYAAGTAAAYAKEVLSVIPAAEVAQTHTAEEVTRAVSKHRSQLSPDLPAKRRKIDSSDGLENSITDQQSFTLTSRPQIKSVKRTQLSPLEKDCLRSLSFPKQEHRYNDIYTARDTCQWLLENAQYQTWTETTRGLFWIKGNPGAGKSVLMKFAIKKMRERKPGELIVSFFIHGQGINLQKTPLGIFRALLNSMLEDFPTYLTRLTATFEDREKRFGGYMEDRWKWTDKELQEFLSDVLTTGAKHQPVTIFVDALDECGEDSAKNLLAYFKDLAKHVESESAQVKICLSSRHYPILSLDSIPAIFVEEWNDKDIQWYTRERLKDIHPEPRRKQIETQIVSKAQGGFQWVFLVTEMVVGGNLNGIRIEKLQEELASCPETLSELYAAILSGVPRSEQYQMVKLFQWVLFAKRPLSAQELRDALATDKDMSCASISKIRAHRGWSNTLIDFERYIKHISRGLVHFQTRDIWEQYVPHGEDSDREAGLIHQSVADYLIDRFLNSTEHGQHKFSSQVGAGHFQISRSCLKYLVLKEVLEGAQLPRGILSAKFPLAPYAARFLLEHIQQVEQEGIIQSDLLSIIQWEPDSETLEKFADLWRTLDPDSAHIPLGWPFIRATAFHVLAALGLGSAFTLLLKASDREVDLKDSNGNTPLLLAIREGCQDIALMLLNQSIDWKHQHQEESDRSSNEHGNTRHGSIDVNAENNDGDTALTIALAEKAEKVIFKLIEAGADLKYMGRETALVHYAISSKNMNLLAKLIEKNLNLDGAVFFALKGGSTTEDDVLEEIMVELLKAGGNTSRSLELERISEPDDYDEYGGEDDSRFDDEALLLASRRGQTSVVNLLLSHGASATSSNFLGEFPLLIAIGHGFGDIAQSLIQYEPSTVEMEDYDGRTALDIALENDQLELIKLLLERGNYSAPSTALERVFFEAIKRGASDLVEAVLQKDSIVLDCQNSEAKTPLSLAAGSGYEAVVKLLLETEKVEVDAKDSDGRTPLLWAAQNGHEAVVKLLLNTGKVEVDAEDSDGRTPLLWAAQNGHEAVVKLLLNTGKVEVNTIDSSGQTPLWQAVQNRYEAVVKLLLETEKIEVDARDSVGRTPLLWAALNGHEAVVKQLLEIGKVEVNAKDRDGRMPLWWAVRNGHEAVVKLLLDTEKVEVDANDKQGRTPLWWAVQSGHEAVVKLLLETEKVEVDAKDKQGRTPLWWAVRNGHEAVVKLLLETGKVEVDVKDKQGRTPLWWAVQSGHEAVVQLLLEIEKVEVDVKNNDRQTLLCWAAQNGHEAVVQLLLSTGKAEVGAEDSEGRTSLWWAVQNGHKAVVKLLLETGKVEVDAKDRDGQTPLWRAVKNGHEAVFQLLLEIEKVEVDGKDIQGRTPLLWASRYGYETVVKLLLETGKVEVDAKDKQGRTPLWWAVRNGHEAVVKLLLKTRKVEVDAKDIQGRTPLLWASRYGYEAVVKLLLETEEAGVDAKDKQGRTPLWWAVRNGHEAVVKLLLETEKVEVDAKDSDGRTPIWRAVQNRHEALVKVLLETGKVEVDAKDKDGQTPLWWASRYGYEAVVKLLLETEKIEVNAKDSNRRTPLWWAVQNRHEAVVKLLLETGKVEIDAKDMQGRTPLLWASRYGYKAVVKLLLETGKVEVDAKDSNGRTPLWWARLNGHDGVVKQLLDTGKTSINML